MIDAAIEQLMHDVLDDVATTEQKARLDLLIAGDPAVRERFELLQEMFQTLERVPMEEAPRDMHAAIMQTIEHDAGRTRHPGWMANLADAFRARPVPAFAMGLVSVSAVGLLLWAGMGEDGALLNGADQPLTGTMAPIAGPRATLESGDARVKITIERGTDALIARIAGEAPAGATLDFEFVTPAVALEGTGARMARSSRGDAADTPVRLTLAGAVNAGLRFELPAATAGDMTVTLATRAGSVKRTIATGPGGTGP
jgi:hypothetical protein